MKKRYIIVALLFLLLLISLVTNPTEKDYLQFSEEQISGTPLKSIEIERVNLYLLSTYTPIVNNEYGRTHLGVFNNFFQISEGQFDYPWWLEFVN